LDDNETVKLEQMRVASTSSKHPSLIVLQGDDLGAAISLAGGGVTIGRGTDCAIRLDDSLASRLHARVLSAAGGQIYCIQDLGSTNGTFVNGQVVEDPYALQDGDKIRVGRHVFKFAWLDEYESAFQQRIQQMIVRDDLTNLLTQRSFFVEFERHIARRNERRESSPIAVLMMDLDHFKSVNDTHGHIVGSQTIKQVGELIEANIGDGAVTARYGGEEFVACLPGVAVEGGRAIAERIRKAIEDHEVVVARKGIEVRLRTTISIGVAAYPSDGDDAIDLIEKADLALYRAKMNGRNRVCLFNPDHDSFERTGYQRLDLSSLLEGSGTLE
jgi:diguanylate cyclase (GGDEF)-like protein